MIKFLLGCIVYLSAAFAYAGPYTDIPKNVQFIMPYGPGSVVDLQYRDFERFLASKGITLVGVYKPGGASVIAVKEFLASPRDGSVLMMNSTSNSLYAEQKLGQKVIDPITTTGGIVHVLITQPGSKYESYDSFVQALKDGDPGLKISWHAVSQLIYLRQITERLGAPMPTLIPYKTSSDPARDASGGHLPVAFVPYSTAKPLVDAGKAKVIFGFSPGNTNILPAEYVNLNKKLPGWRKSELFFVGVPPGTDDSAFKAWTAIYKEYLALASTEEYFKSNFFSKDVGGPKYVNETILHQGELFKKYNIEVLP